MVSSEQAKETAAKQIEVTDKAVNHGIKKFEESSIGKKIPTSLKNVKFSQIFVTLFGFQIYSSLATHLIICKKSSSSSSWDMNRIIDILFYVIMLGVIITDGLSFFLSMIKVLFLPNVVLKMAKVCLLIFILINNTVLSSNFNGMLDKLSIAAFCMVNIMVDMVSVYYANKLKQRVESNDYDSKGDKISDTLEIEI